MTDNFNIKPGMMSWQDMPDGYKRAFLNSKEGQEYMRLKALREQPTPSVKWKQGRSVRRRNSKIVVVWI